MSDTAAAAPAYKPSASTFESDLDIFAVDNLETAQALKALVKYWIWDAPKEARVGYRTAGKALAELEV